jgi:TRAP-type C4-dicarboxylate transport system permease small subunit
MQGGPKGSPFFHGGIVKRILDWINGLLLFIVFAIMVLQVLCRTVLKIAIPWSDEMARSVYTLVVFIGAATAMKDDSHIKVDVLLQFLPPKGKRIFRIISFLCVIPFIVIVAIGAFSGARLYWNTILPSIWWLTVGHMNLIFGFCCVLMVFYSVVNIINDIRNKNPPAADQG